LSPTEWRTILAKLRRAKLLASEDPLNREHLDTHPLVREYFGEQLRSQRYFVPQSQSRALLRNGVARLWWTAHVSFDPERANNYELTGTLLARLDITQQILERNMGRAPSVLKRFPSFFSPTQESAARRRGH
jgi:Family of unknown function (DUF6339)